MVFEVGLVAATPAAIFVSSEPPVAACAAAGLAGCDFSSSATVTNL